MDTKLYPLEKAVEEITGVAEKFGLDFFPVRFEICPAEVLYTFGAYGMPTRYTHWSFGKAYYRLKIMYDFNLSRIYELVVNSNPCYAFLLEGNSLVQNKLVVAHVLAHADFFKNNAWFTHTNRDMVETMAVHACRIREYEFQFGRQEVEKFLDAVLSIQEHIDSHHMIKRGQKNWKKKKPVSSKETPYDDIWQIGERKDRELPPVKKASTEPEKDLLAFLMKESRILTDWQRDILAMVRQEMYYFWPQMETKIINEGWAAFWHARIMRVLELTDDEVLDFAHLHSGIIQSTRTQINPYLLGMRIFEDILSRWNETPKTDQKSFQLNGKGLTKIFEVRETENDISFIRNYLTKDLVRELDLYLYKKQGQQWRVVDTDWATVRDGLVSRLVNGGHPYLVVEDGDYLGSGQLYLGHRHEGVDLDIYYLEKTLPLVYRLWGKTVHLQTVLEGKNVLFSFDGNKNSRSGI